MPTVSDDFNHTDPGEYVGDDRPGYQPVVGRLTATPPAVHYATDRHAHIREQCATIQQVAITIAIPVFAVLTAILLAGLCRAVWTF